MRKVGQAATIEVAALFVGIFICMQPALALLHVHGDSLGLASPQAYFWSTGVLSAVLDNAPTYLVFFKAAGIEPADGLTGEEARLQRGKDAVLRALWLCPPFKAERQ
jgi:Na+/H+ antiporter NhaD/arsenite permease-like protein